MEKTHTKVRIAGQDFRLTGDNSEEYIQRLAEFVNNRISEMQQTYPKLSTMDCALLASLNIADELHQLKAEYDAMDTRISALRDLPHKSVPAAPVKRPFETREPVTTK